MDGHWVLTIISCKPSLKLFLLQLNEKLQRTQCQPFYGHLVFEANWKGEKT